MSRGPRVRESQREYIRDLLREGKLSQIEIAEKAHVSPSVVSHIKTKMISRDVNATKAATIPVLRPVQSALLSPKSSLGLRYDESNLTAEQVIDKLESAKSFINPNKRFRLCLILTEEN